MADCVFCEIIAGRAAADIVYENESTIAVIDLRQHNPGHVLVIPKAHINDVRGLDERTAGAGDEHGGEDRQGGRSGFPERGYVGLALHRPRGVSRGAAHACARPSAPSG